MIKTIIELLLKPLTSLGEKYMETQVNKDKIKAGTDAIVYKTDAAVRKVKQSSILGRIPLFIMEVSCAMYVAAILFDSTFATNYLNPLKLPTWFEPHFAVVLASVAGISAVERILRPRR